MSYHFVFEGHNSIKHFCQSQGVEIARGDYFFVKKIFRSFIRYSFNFFSEILANSKTVQKKLLNLLATVVGSSDVVILLSLTLEGASRLDLLGNTDFIIFQVSREFFCFYPTLCENTLILVSLFVYLRKNSFCIEFPLMK